MKVALIGATGFVGSKVLQELLDRGHNVTGIVRHPEKLPTHDKLRAVKCDIDDGDAMSIALSGHDVVIISAHFTDFDPSKLLDGVHKSGVRRFLIVGGAGSLFVKPGLQLVDTPEFPAVILERALAARDFQNLIKNEKNLEWTYLSPQMMLVPGERTGKFRLGKDDLLYNEQGQSTISVDDLAVALVDEMEKPQFIRQRFTAGY